MTKSFFLPWSWQQNRIDSTYDIHKLALVITEHIVNRGLSKNLDMLKGNEFLSKNEFTNLK